MTARQREDFYFLQPFAGLGHTHHQGRLVTGYTSSSTNITCHFTQLRYIKISTIDRDCQVSPLWTITQLGRDRLDGVGFIELS